MRNREDMNAVIEGLQRDHALLAAFLEATDKIEIRARYSAIEISASRSQPTADGAAAR